MTSGDTARRKYERRLQREKLAADEPCACSPARPCLLHFSQMSQLEQQRAWERARIHISGSQRFAR